MQFELFKRDVVVIYELIIQKLNDDYTEEYKRLDIAFSKEEYSGIRLACQEKWATLYGVLETLYAERVVNGCKKRRVDVITHDLMGIIPF